MLFVTAAPAAAQVGKDIEFFSEGVVCHGRMFVPAGFSPAAKAAAVVLAPGAGDTASSIEAYAARLASQGIVALAIDYRGWGRSGAFIYMAEPIRWDDRLRFSQHTAKVRLRRKRLAPDAQIVDIRNAITYLQGEPGVDRARIGVWGADLAGGHVVSVAAMDAQGQGRRRARAGDCRQGSSAGRVEADRRRAGRARQAGAQRSSVGDRGHGWHDQRSGGAPRAR